MQEHLRMHPHVTIWYVPCSEESFQGFLSSNKLIFVKLDSWDRIRRKVTSFENGWFVIICPPPPPSMSILIDFSNQGRLRSLTKKYFQSIVSRISKLKLIVEVYSTFDIWLWCWHFHLQKISLFLSSIFLFPKRSLLLSQVKWEGCIVKPPRNTKERNGIFSITMWAYISVQEERYCGK